jgi:hypothetical protein
MLPNLSRVLTRSPFRFSMACLAVVSSFALIRCGGSGDSSGADTAGASTQNIGNMNFSCGGRNGGGGSGQSKKVQYQQQSSGGCDQKVEFEEQKVSDFDVNLDCDQQMVSVKNKGADQKQETFPITQDGSVHGQLHFQSKIKGPQQYGGQNAAQDDGQNCWVEYVVSFDGKADCDSNENSKMKFSTQVNFQQTNQTRLAEAGIPGAAPPPAHETRTGLSEASHSGERRTPNPESSDPVTTWTPEPGLPGSGNGSTSASPTSPAGFPSNIPSATASTEPTSLPSPSPSTSSSASPRPSPSLIPVVVCAVQKPCTVTSDDEDFSCPQ